MGTSYELDLDHVETEHVYGQTTCFSRQLAISLFVDGDLKDRLVLDREDLLWLLEEPK